MTTQEVIVGCFLNVFAVVMLIGVLLLWGVPSASGLIFGGLFGYGLTKMDELRLKKSSEKTEREHASPETVHHQEPISS